MSKSYYKLNMYEEALMWGEKAAEIYPKTRDVYTSLLEICSKNKDYDKAIEYGLKALKIEEPDNTVVNDAKSWNGTIFDYMSLAYFYKKDYKNAIKYIDMDLKMHPDNKRLLDNKRTFERECAAEEE